MQATLSLGWTYYSPCGTLLPAAVSFGMKSPKEIIGYSDRSNTFPFYRMECGSIMP